MFYETTNTTKDGKEYWVSSTLTPIWDENDKLKKLVVIDTDIAERKKTEKALRESENKYRTLLNQIADPIFIFEKNSHHFLDCNDAVFRIYGYTREEFSSITPLDLHPTEERAEVKKQLDVKNTDEPKTYVHVTKDGWRMDVEIFSNEIEYQGRAAWPPSHVCARMARKLRW
ncbi:PAS domain S-box protein [candidate division KSB1 bacterium]|nr:PAS domain S-box protein [candidate division KSB1 bacterium]NIS27444.1 PAS domain S-box protein [candidate division KSB1 bacterium]NIT74268.1 PAS domain S-box protein [candidate division KSB1 bacterium]NIU28161.1 PAS domain S-box protein [candidate division KSB1 bacterium]NIU91413.1 PAS domain S-box protein [candidate division KSB1 bacterium]